MYPWFETRRRVAATDNQRNRKSAMFEQMLSTNLQYSQSCMIKGHTEYTSLFSNSGEYCFKFHGAGVRICPGGVVFSFFSLSVITKPFRFSLCDLCDWSDRIQRPP